MTSDRIAGWLTERATPTSDGRSEELQALLTRYENLTIEQAFSPLVLNIGDGWATIEHQVDVPVAFPSLPEIETALLSNLRLIYGIGGCYSDALKAEGYDSILALRSHPRWSHSAAALLQEWGAPFDLCAVYQTLCNWLSASDSLFLRLLGLVPRDEIVLLDLETLGLSNAPVFLIATGRLNEAGIVVHQHLAFSLAAELSLLERMSHELERASALISYNGKTFDWTVLKERFAYYGLPLQKTPMHVDLLHHARRRLRDDLPDLRLSTVENLILGVRRRSDLPSALVPSYYAAFLETGNPGPLVPIVHHNRQDIVSLALLLEVLLRTADDA